MTDTPNVTLGIDLPESIYYPFKDPKVTLEGLPDLFSTWVSTLYPPVSDLSVTDSELAARKDIFETTGDPKDKPTWERMTQAEHDSIRDPTVVHRSGGRILGPGMNKDIFLNNYKKALLDTNGVLSNVDVLILWCNQAVSDCVYGAKLISEGLRETAEDQKRKARIQKIDGANHFVSYRYPFAGRIHALMLELLPASLGGPRENGPSSSRIPSMISG